MHLSFAYLIYVTVFSSTGVSSHLSSPLIAFPRYTKRLLDTATSPESSLSQFQDFEKALKNMHDSLPPELHFSPRSFQLRAFSPDRTTFIVLHIYYHHCHCELYRLLNPGYREALPATIIRSTTPALVAYAQSKCLEHAICIGEIIASTQNIVETEPYVTDVSSFIVLYQASCAILYACHRDSPSLSMEPETARYYFTAFIKTLQALLRYFPRFYVYVNDIRNMLRSIEEPNAPLPPQIASTEVDFRMRRIPSEPSSEDESRTAEPAEVLQRKEAAILDSSNAPQMLENTRNTNLNLSTQAPITIDSGQNFDWPDFGTPDDGNFFAAGHVEQDILWDWAGAIGANFDV